jgi:hypothetical protein
MAIEDLLPNGSKFRNNEIFKINPIEKVIFGEKSLRMRYDKLFICAGLEPDFSQVEGLLYALDDTQSNVFSAYHFEKAVSKMSVFTHCLKKRIINYQKLTQRDINFMQHGYGNIVYCCLDNYQQKKKVLKEAENLNSSLNKNNYDNDSEIDIDSEKIESKNFRIAQNDKFNNLHLIDEFYSGFFECVNNLILLYDLLQKNRKGEEQEKYMETVNFSIAVPYSEKFFMENLALKLEELKNSSFDLIIDLNDPAVDCMLGTTKILLTDFLLNELQKRKIQILWDHKLRKISLNNKLWFENGSELEFNFCYVSPNLTLPSILKYGILNPQKIDKIEIENNEEINNEKEMKSKNKDTEKEKNNIKNNIIDKHRDRDSKANLKLFSEMKFYNFDENLLLEEYVDYSSLRLKPFEDIYIMGDTLKTFYNRQYHNCFLQAHTVANNVKVERNQMNKKFMQEYISKKSLFFDYDLKHYLFLKNGKIELVKKNFLNNYLVEGFYREHDNRWMLKYLLKKRLGISLSNLK